MVWSVVELQPLLRLYSPILDQQNMLQLLLMNSVVGSVGADGTFCCLRSLSSHPTAPLSSPHSLSACLDSKHPVTSTCSYSFPACEIDIASLQNSFTNIFETKGRLTG